MIRILLLVLFALPAVAQDVRVLSFNIRYNNFMDGANAWPHRKEAVAQLIEKTADVAGLQEVKPEQRSWLIEHLPQFGVLGVGREPEDRDESVPIVYRKDRFEVLASGTFWLSENPDVAGSTSWGNKLPRICTWAKLRDIKPNHAIFFYNVHLDHQSGAARQRGAALVADHIVKREGNEPAILVGDFNCTFADAPLKALATRENPALVSTYDALGVPAEGTFHGFTGKTGTRAIDYIFFQKDRWKVKSGSIIKTTYRGTDGVDRYVSDHFPIDAVLEPIAPAKSE